MTEIKLNATRYFIPTSITAAALCIVTATDQDQLPLEYYSSLPDFSIRQKAWEEQYVPSNSLANDFQNIETIQRFVVTLLRESEDIPEEFAKVINEDFWEII
jgi:hypothetical protein